MKHIQVKKHENKARLIIQDLGFSVDVVLSDDEFGVLKKKICEIDMTKDKEKLTEIKQQCLSNKAFCDRNKKLCQFSDIVLKIIGKV